MSAQSWGLSSSSESDSSDDERPCTKIKRNTEFYRNFLNGEYGVDWPSDVYERSRANHRNHSTPANHRTMPMQNVHANGHPNGHANISVNNINGSIAGLNESMILNSSMIDVTPANVALVSLEDGKFQLMRVVTKTEILTPNTTPDTKPKVSVVYAEKNC